MCFITDIKLRRDLIPKIAKRKIKVYKIIKIDGSPWWYAIKMADGTPFKWEEGWHYYQVGKPFTFNKCLGVWEIHQGLHSYKYEPYSCLGRVIKLYIPKGVLYFENEMKYVSSELVFPHSKI